MSQSVLKLARAALLDGRLCCVLQLVKFGFFAVIDESLLENGQLLGCCQLNEGRSQLNV